MPLPVLLMVKHRERYGLYLRHHLLIGLFIRLDDPPLLRNAKPRAGLAQIVGPRSGR